MKNKLGGFVFFVFCLGLSAQVIQDHSVEPLAGKASGRFFRSNSRFLAKNGASAIRP